MWDRTRLVAGLACFLSFLLLYGITSRADLQVSDEAAVFVSAISLESEGNLYIDNLRWLQERLEQNLGEEGRGNHLYSKYFPGNVITSALIYRLAERKPDTAYIWRTPQDLDPPMDFMKLADSNTGARAALRLNAMLGALGMTALLLLLLRYFDLKVSILGLVVTALCSDWWYQSRGYLSEVGAGAFLAASLCATAYQRPYQSGIALGLSLFFRPTNLVALPVWARAVVDQRGKAFLSAVAILGALSGLMLFNWLRFGSVFIPGYGQEGFTPSILMGLFGNLLSPGRSLFLYSPILVLAIPGARLFWRRDKCMAAVAIGAVIGHLLLISAWHAWDGGWTWGSRLLTPIVPVLGFLVTPAIEVAWKRRRDLMVVLFLAMLGFTVQIVALARNPVQTLVDRVVYGGIPYEETIFTPKHAWIALQMQSLRQWQICDLDAYALRQWIGECQSEGMVDPASAPSQSEELAQQADITLPNSVPRFDLWVKHSIHQMFSRIVQTKVSNSWK